MKQLLTIILSVIIVSSVAAIKHVNNLQQPAPDLSPFFKDTTGAFALYDLKKDRSVTTNNVAAKGLVLSQLSRYPIPSLPEFTYGTMPPGWKQRLYNKAHHRHSLKESFMKQVVLR